MSFRSIVRITSLTTVALCGLVSGSFAQFTGFNFSTPSQESAPMGYLNRLRFSNVASGLDMLIDVASVSHNVAYTSAPLATDPAGYFIGTAGNDLSIRLYNGDTAIGQFINLRASIVDTATTNLATPLNFILGSYDYDWNSTHYRERAAFSGPNAFCVSSPYSNMLVTEQGTGSGIWEAKAGVVGDVSPSTETNWAFFNWGATNQFDISWAWDGLYTGGTGQFTTNRFLQLDGYAQQSGGVSFTNAPLVFSPPQNFNGPASAAPEPGSLALLGLLGSPLGLLLRRRV